jgi:3',5'-cyclic AMP phosphodiesterase CpdA
VYRLAHFSDIHVTLSPFTEGLRGLLGKPKRVVGSLNYAIGGRKKHFAGVTSRIGALLDDVRAQRVDHALCTGDLTAMSFEAEMAEAARLFAAREATPDRWTVLPGNHDRYVHEPADEPRIFERHFAALADDGRGYPYTKRLSPRVSLVAVDVTRPTSLLDSSGRAGKDQLARLAALLASPELAGDFVIVALHYALLRAGGHRDRRNHGVRDDRALMAVLDDARARVDLVLHGHIHRHYGVRTAAREVRCAGSATDLHVQAGYDVYAIDPEARTFTVERRSWNGAGFETRPATV